MELNYLHYNSEALHSLQPNHVSCKQLFL